MAPNQKKNDENLKKITGFTGVIHKIVMFVTYPFRKPLRCLFFLAALGALAYFIPVLYGVKPDAVYDWYVNLAHDVNEQVILPHNRKGTDTLVETADIRPTAREVRRQMFAKASGQAPQKVDVLASQAGDVVNIDDIRRASEDTPAYRLPMADVSEDEPEFVKAPVPQPAAVPAVPEKFDYRSHFGEFDSLDYVDEVVEVRGAAKVYNANELSVGDTYIFLYGIFSNPLNERGVRAGVFLKSFVKDEEVRCEILAYTKDGGVATAECYVGDVDINRLMVTKGFSDKVSAR